MAGRELHYFVFGPFRLDAAEGVLLHGDDTVPLTPKAFDTLLALVERAGSLVTKEELMLLLWPGSFVEESSITQNISVVRRALGEKVGERQYIETVPKRGYR